MYIMIKGNYVSLNDVQSVTEICSVGEGFKFFIIRYKQGSDIEFSYQKQNQTDVHINSKGNFHFGTDCFFYNAHKEILNILTNATQLPKLS
jgi:hypothetical protein